MFFQVCCKLLPTASRSLTCFFCMHSEKSLKTSPTRYKVEMASCSQQHKHPKLLSNVPQFPQKKMSTIQFCSTTKLGFSLNTAIWPLSSSCSCISPLEAQNTQSYFRLQTIVLQLERVSQLEISLYDCDLPGPGSYLIQAVSAWFNNIPQAGFLKSLCQCIFPGSSQSSIGLGA